MREEIKEQFHDIAKVTALLTAEGGLICKIIPRYLSHIFFSFHLWLQLTNFKALQSVRKKNQQTKTKPKKHTSDLLKLKDLCKRMELLF